MSLPENAGPIRADTLSRLLPSCPWLQKIFIKSQVTSRDTTLDRIIPLKSLEELDHTYSIAGRFLPA